MDIKEFLKNHSGNTEEIIKKARQSRNPQDLLAIAKEFDLDMQASEAEELWELVKQLTEEELDMVAGGKTHDIPCPNCGSYEYLWVATFPHYRCIKCGNEYM